VTADTAFAAKRILGAFSGGIEQVQSTPLYCLGLAIVALAMLLLVASYLALLVACCGESITS
jgi:hypothetical protein